MNLTEYIAEGEGYGGVTALCTVLYRRSARRLRIITTGIIFAKGRKTITSWFRAAGITQRYKPFYYFIGSINVPHAVQASRRFKMMLTMRRNINNKTLD